MLPHRSASRVLLVALLSLCVITPSYASTWTQVGSDIDGEAEDDYSGSSVSMSSDGKRVAIGTTDSYTGHVRVYHLPESAPSDKLALRAEKIDHGRRSLLNYDYNYSYHQYYEGCRDDVPAEWTGPCIHYGTDNGCDCEYGVWDPDCDEDAPNSERLYNCDHVDGYDNSKQFKCVNVDGGTCEAIDSCTVSTDSSKTGDDGTFYCINGGTAGGTTGSCTCTCSAGYSGTNCQTADACSASSTSSKDGSDGTFYCINGGITGGTTGLCTCTSCDAGYGGVSCQTGYFAGYEPLTNVARDSMIDLDLIDIESALGSNCGEALGECGGTAGCPTNSCEYESGIMTFPTADGHCEFTVTDYENTNSPACSNAYDIWKHGKNSPKSSGMRSISGFASGAATKGSSASVPYKSNAFISVMNAYWKGKDLDEYTWGEQMIKGAFEGILVGDLNFGIVGRTFRKEAIKKGLVYLNIYPYAIWEMQDQVNKCKAQSLTSNADASVKAWDEAVAFWAGSKTLGYGYDVTIPDDELQYAQADKRCQNFGTCAAGFSGTAKVNQELLALFKNGQELARAGTITECDPMDDIHEKIGTLMLVPFIQGMLQYLYKTKDAQDAKTTGELWAFATAILPFVHEVNPAAAEALYKRAWLLDFSGDYVADKKLIESTYSELGVGAGKGMITCAGIGDLHSDPSTVLSAGTCFCTRCEVAMKKIGLATLPCELRDSGDLCDSGSDFGTDGTDAEDTGTDAQDQPAILVN
jgi:hypothetical protein